MRDQDDISMDSLTGRYSTIRLEIELDEPLTDDELIDYAANYPTILAYLRIYLDGGLCSNLVPSAYIHLLLDHLLAGIPILLQGGNTDAHWVSDSWQFTLLGKPEEGLLDLTLGMPGHLTLLNQVEVPIEMFVRQVLKIADEWEEYLVTNHRDEIEDRELGQEYRLFISHLSRARGALA